MGSSSSAHGRPRTSTSSREVTSPNQYHGHQRAPPAYGSAQALYPNLDGVGSAAPVDPRRHSMTPSFYYPSQQGAYPTQIVHPQVRTDFPARQGAPPPTGFKEVNFENPPQEGADHDTSRDLTLSRVFAADEFLGRMAETDEKIKVMSSVREEDKSSVYERLKQHLGLRGHLQDELLRIQVMLAEDDPELTCLDGLEDFCPNAVRTLRQLNEKAKQIQKGEAPTEQLGAQLDMDLNPLQPELIGAMINDDSDDSSGDEEEIELFAGGREGGSDGQGGITGGRGGGAAQTDTTAKEEDVKQDLKNKHDESMQVLKEKEVMEELHVASKFAQKITKANRNLSQDEINDLLNQHAISMQALRKKQEVERKYLTDKLEAKKRERMLKRPQLSERRSEGESLAGPSQETPPNDGSLYRMPGYVVQLNFDKTKSNPSGTPDTKHAPGIRKGSMPNVPIGRATIITSQRNPDVGQGHLGVKEKVKDRHGSASSRGSSRKGKSEALDSDDDLDDLIASVNYDEGEYSSDDFEDGSEDDEVNETLRTTLQDDLWSNRSKMTSEDFKALMGAYRSQEDERKKVRHAEKDRQRQGLLTRLAENKRRGKEAGSPRERGGEEAGPLGESGRGETGGHGDEELTSEQIKVIRESDTRFSQDISQRIRGLSDDDFRLLLQRHLQDVEEVRRMRGADRDRLDAKLRERLASGQGRDVSDEYEDRDLDNLRSEFTRKLCSKRRYLDEEDLQTLLEQYHKDRSALMQARKGDRERMDEKLKQKLQEKNRNSKENEKTSSKGKKADALDSGFFEKIQDLQSEGALSKEEFNSMLQEYLNKAGGGRARRRRDREQAEEDRKHVHRTASALVRESHDQRKQIDLVRQREKAAMDEKLKRKLQMAAPK